MADQMGKPVSEAADHGVGLAFVAYPAALSRLPAPYVWSFAFFFMLIILGLGSEMTLVETIVVNISEIIPEGRFKPRKIYLLALACIVMFASGLPMCTQAGIYILQLMDSFAVPYSAFVIGFCEVLAIAWVYGIDRHLANVRLMIGLDICWPWYWKWLIKLAIPIIIVVLLVLVLTQHSPLTYNDYEYPLYANLIGWAMTLSSVILVPLFALYELSRVWLGKTSYKVYDFLKFGI